MRSIWTHHGNLISLPTTWCMIDPSLAIIFVESTPRYKALYVTPHQYILAYLLAHAGVAPIQGPMASWMETKAWNESGCLDGCISDQASTIRILACAFPTPLHCCLGVVETVYSYYMPLFVHAGFLSSSIYLHVVHDWRRLTCDFASNI